MDAGGLAQMSYNNNFNGGIPLPGAGFASRGKGSQLKRLSVASPPKVASISEDQVDNTTTPRTSRSYLLAGLRTQPKTPSGLPSSAPYNMAQYRLSADANKYANAQKTYSQVQNAPHTSIGTSFPSSASQQYSMSAGQQFYSLPEQVLAPPPLQFEGEDEEIDPQLEAQLRAHELYLAQRHQMLQQKLMDITAQQFQNMNLGGGSLPNTPHFPQTPGTPQMSLYNQQLMNGVAPVTQEVAGHPGLYLVYNPLTGQQSYVMDPNAQQTRLANSPPPSTPSYATSTFQEVRNQSPARDSSPSPWTSRSVSPPKKTPSPPQDVEPLPPPSANAFRRGHKKISSLSLNNGTPVSDGPRSAIVRPVGFPQTPMTGTFGPGQGRAGEHPVRQPRGPPPMEELTAAPTAKHEGSKNFAARQRRRALHSLVKAGMERRHVQTGSGGSITPVSETEMTFSVPSDNDSDSVRSVGSRGSLTNKLSIGSLRAVANGAIGSERKELRRMNSGDRTPSADKFPTAASLSSDDGVTVGGKLVEVSVEAKPMPGDRRRMPLLALTNAEKRKSTLL